MQAEQATMADAIVGTAGIFFTLAIIAVASFIVGLGIYGVVDHLRATRKRGHSRKHHAQPSRYVTITVALGHAITSCTDHRATALLSTFVKGEPEGGVKHWLCRVELACALLCSVRGYFAAQAPRQQVEALRNLISDVAAGDLHRCRPVGADKDVQDFLAKRLRECAEVPGDLSNLYEPPYGVYRICAYRIGEWLEVKDPKQKESLERNISEMLKSAVTVEIAMAMK